MQSKEELKKNKFLEDIVKAHTKYASEDLRLDALIEEELGIDSIMLAIIVGDINRKFSIEKSVSAYEVTTLASLYEKYKDVDASGIIEAGCESDNNSQTLGDSFVSDVSDTKVAGLTLRDFVSDASSDLFSKVRKFNSFYSDKKKSGLLWYGMPSIERSANRSKIYDEYAGKEREFLMFASNNYLGLANDERVLDAICKAVKQYGATNTGCRLIGGTTKVHLELEERLAAFKGREKCIVFPSGYSANVGTISALLGSKDTVITDVYNHMSIQDGCALSGAKKKIYKHNDMASLEEVLKRCSDQEGGKLIVADGVFSMHGDIVDLPKMTKLAKKYQARVLIDDAHSTGVLGKTGSGTAEHFGLKDDVDLELGTMSKALAGMGGFVVGDADVIEYLRFYANSYVFAATIPAGVSAGLIECLNILESEPERLEKLRWNSQYLKSALDECGFNTEKSESAIIPVVIGDEEKTMAMGRSVRKKGMFCQTVVFPGVAVGDGRLRISVLNEHTKEDLDEAINILIDSARENGLSGI